MVKKRKTRKVKNTRQQEVTKKLIDASGINNTSPLTDPEQRKSFYVIDGKAEGALYHGKKRKKKNQQ